MNVCVVDASVAGKWFLNEEHTEAARRLLARENRFYAPDFFLLEMDNVFCKRIRCGDLTPADGQDARLLLSQLPIEYYPFGPLRGRAYEIANTAAQSVYDCVYVALAMLLDGTMVTADRRLYSRLSKGRWAKHVTWVEDAA